ncbi:helix-turn-helix domain-containing protein [Rubinisphaera sp.]|uniref:TetR/AcrR family transcriptional regulator n=1 Tax=Rubinisphaera sp. TaxID=2024857 RepID=UPI000C0E6455|nr:helix-turn-helix domain-containing protein [Rubinisphaera sp.]MBV10825.1 hypothetical protein [Rubinisphaera sp.]HCS50994.1 hypothetical protein [Planctomycetaceae bacterium]|tara:strand:- start:11205 stop:11402 length:198 start_codon:yes stop_codon:yes gene_type:complete
MTTARNRKQVLKQGAESSAKKPPGGDTREHLLDCALTLFAERGYAATSVRDIIHAAEVTQPTLYY